MWKTCFPQFKRRLCRIFRYGKSYKRIKEYKNIHLGERCFIIATGPSLTIEDIEKLNGEITFGLNTGVYLIEKSSWRPSYYVIQDFEVFKNIKNDLSKIDKHGIVKFVGDTATQHVPKKDVLYSLKLYDHLAGGQKIDFSADCFKYVSDGWTVTYSAIQLAIYMGFNEIYLLGCDSNYGEKLHADICVKKGVREKPVKGSSSYKRYSDVAYECAKKYSNSHMVQIYNCTKGGMLEVFPRKNLEHILSDSKMF